jgi:hypothetical protein
MAYPFASRVVAWRAEDGSFNPSCPKERFYSLDRNSGLGSAGDSELQPRAKVPTAFERIR